MIIVDKSCNLIVKLNSDLTVKLDDYEYTIEQLQKSVYSQMNLFTISKLGDSILFVSHLQGFWIRFDKTGDSKIGISSKYKSFVDGLCGYYNDYQNDDKRLPNGTNTMSTIDFGDGWLRDIDSKQKCQPTACSQAQQDTAWEMCKKIKDETFATCSNVVDVDHFISKCLETACECLKSKDISQQNECKCAILQNYVTECMANDGSQHFDAWRSKYDCLVECPATLIHHDCYRRRCEHTCDTINKENCEYLPGTCFSGCYCAEGFVRKADKCIPVSDCKNCVCDGFGRSQYITYDRKNFTFDANCTYLLSRDTKIPNLYAFQVYVTLAPCNDSTTNNSIQSNQRSCITALHILYGEHVVHLQKETNSIKAFVDGIEVNALQFKTDWIEIIEEHGKGLNIDLIKSLVEVNTIFDDLSFSIKIPSIKYGSNVEGLCGNCNGDPSDDLKVNPKHSDKVKTNELNDILQTWLAEEPTLNLTQKCVTKAKIEDECIPLPPEMDPCLQLLDSNTFGQCHLIVNALKYVSMCQIDLCKTGSNQNGACSYLSAYARECLRNGICVDWKKGVCNEKFECPDDMEYKACSCHKTCDYTHLIDIRSSMGNKTDDKCTELVDGCFCKNGKRLNNLGICVTERECRPCDDKNHFVGDKWQQDKCTDCECSEKGIVSCTKKLCASQSGIICQLGFKNIVIEPNANECCPTYKCVPEIVTAKCQEKPLPKCASDQYVKIMIDASNCTSYVCECKPANECKFVKHRPLLIGEKLINETNGCCMQRKIICDKSQCPQKPKKCDQEFYEVAVKPQNKTDLCCEEFTCIPPSHLCIIDEGKSKFVKKIDEIWSTNDPCVKRKCVFGKNKSPIVSEEHEKCSVTNCSLGFKLQIAKDKCCGQCVQEKCVFNNVTMDINSTWLSSDNCTTFKCSMMEKQLIISSSQATCSDVSDCPIELKYFENCCERCKPRIEDKSKLKSSLLLFSRKISRTTIF